MNYPYSDNHLQYDYDSHRYILTKQYCLEVLKVDVDELAVGDGNVVLNDISEEIYDYIHNYSVDTMFQDFIIAKTEGGRKIIKEAMSKQLKYELAVGKLKYSVDERVRALWLDAGAKSTLLKMIPEIGTSICYTGSLWFKTDDKTNW